jgi:hypothetical protein
MLERRAYAYAALFDRARAEPHEMISGQAVGDVDFSAHGIRIDAEHRC